MEKAYCNLFSHSYAKNYQLFLTAVLINGASEFTAKFVRPWIHKRVVKINRVHIHRCKYCSSVAECSEVTVDLTLRT